MLEFNTGVFFAILVAVFLIVLFFAPHRLRDIFRRSTLIILLIICFCVLAVGWRMGRTFHVGSSAGEGDLKQGIVYEVIAESPKESGKPLAARFIVIRDHQSDGSDVRLIRVTRSYPWLFSVKENGGVQTIAARPLDRLDDRSELPPQ
jgi:hypothetical protein